MPTPSTSNGRSRRSLAGNARCVRLRYLLDLNTAETAITLRINEGTVKSELSRARATLAQRLGTVSMEEANDARP